MHSGAHFSIRHLMIAHVHGHFTGISGTLTLDKSNPANSEVDVTVDINSLQTGQTARDEHLKAADFFDAAQYPTMTFRSKSITPKEGHMHIVGDLMLHGVTKEVTLDTTGSSDEVKDVWGGQRVGFSAQTKINRSDFGISWNAPMETGGFVLGEEVTVILEVEFIRKA
jgi:polyisoprenoid-binding protein YceI